MQKIHCLVWGGDGKAFFCGHHDGTVSRWNPRVEAAPEAVIGMLRRGYGEFILQFTQGESFKEGSMPLPTTKIVGVTGKSYGYQLSSAILSHHCQTNASL